MSPGPDSARPHATPEGRDIRLLVMGVFLFAGAMLNAGLPQIKGPSHAIGLVVVLVIFLALLALPAHTLRGRKGDWRRFTICTGRRCSRWRACRSRVSYSARSKGSHRST